MLRVIAVLGIVLSLATAAECQEPTAPLEQVHEGYVVAEDGVRLYYDVRGSGQDTLVVLHGGPGLSSAYLVPDFDFLARSRTLVFYDQRGAGRSTVVTDSSRLRLADHVRDVEAVRRHFGLERVNLLGFSWGGALAAQYARAHPSRTARLILVGPMPPRATPYSKQFGRNLHAWMDSTTVEQVATLSRARRDASDPVAACRAYWNVFIRGYFADPHDTITIERMRGDLCNAPPEAIRNSGLVGASVFGPLGDWDWRDDFRHVEAPVLIIHGDKDPIPVASASEWEAAFPEATLVVVEDAGHVPHVERPDAILRAIEAFLR